MTNYVNDAAKTAFLFPGQGSQYVGMAREFLAENEEARRLMGLAEQVSGLPLARLCLEGPVEELTRTLHLQPAMTVVNLICLQAVRQAGIGAACFAGHSLGEYSALAAAGILSPEDTLRLVTERGRLMERESAAQPGAMSAILKLTMEEVQEMVTAAAGKGVVVAANHNSEQQIVISGEAAGVAEAARLAAAKGGKAVPLPVSGAWHSPLVAGAVPDFSRIMEGVTFRAPVGQLLFNVTASPENDPAVIRSIMSRQLASMVRWYETILAMRRLGVTTFIEIGPKNVLTGLVKKILPKADQCLTLQVDTPAGLAAVLDALRK